MVGAMGIVSIERPVVDLGCRRSAAGRKIWTLAKAAGVVSISAR